MTAILLIASFGVILAGALLFTNAVEWIGHRLAMGEGAVGSLLAAVGTAMPETLIAVVALVSVSEGSEDVAVGAIVGAPFLLGTVAMMLVGLFAYLYRDRRKQGTDLNAHMPTLGRDLRFFGIFFGLGLTLGWGAPGEIRIPVACAMVVAYVLYVRRTLAGGGDVQAEDTLNPLTIGRGRAATDPPIPLSAIQLLVGLGAMVGGAHLFVEELLIVAEDIGVEALVLSLILAPLATELPEKVNSFFWVREGKDSLALGNITGAMVFQSTIPIALGLAFTDWDLNRYAAVSIGLGLAGGAIAYWALRLRARYSLWAVAGWGVLYACFLIFVIAG